MLVDRAEVNLLFTIKSANDNVGVAFDPEEIIAMTEVVDHCENLCKNRGCGASWRTAGWMDGTSLASLTRPARRVLLGPDSNVMT